QALADRYTYIPLIGLFIIVAWGLGDLVARRPELRRIVIGGAIAAVAACAVCSWLQVRHWKNSVALWEHALAVSDDNYVARTNLGMAYMVEKRDAARAEEHFRAATRLRPGYVRGLSNLGLALDKQGRLEEAIACYRE